VIERLQRRQYQIGALAAEFGINTKTVRYYEEIGLLTAPERTDAGYRVFTDTEREQLRFIIKAKATGLTLEEIGEVLTLRRHGQLPCEQVRTILDRKLASVERQIAALRAFREELLTLRAETEDTMGSEACVCGIIEQHQPVLTGM
jgi:DNA-binding transcriptional MerR regulator